jgi:hypothetical protein
VGEHVIDGDQDFMRDCHGRAFVPTSSQRETTSKQSPITNACTTRLTPPRPRLLKRIFMPSGAPPAHEKIVINVTKMVAAGVSQL